MESSCLFHKDRCQFDIMNRDVEKAKLLPRVQARKLAMCVCSCTKKRINLTEKVKQLELQEMAEFLRQCIGTENWPVSLVTTLKAILPNIRIEDYSRAMFITILYNAVKHKNYDLIDSFIEKKVSKDTDTSISKGDRNMTQTQYQFMMNKKWRKSEHKLNVLVHMFAGNSKLLQNNEEVKAMFQLHKDVVLKIDNKANDEFMEKNLKKMKIKLAGKSEKDLLKVASKLREIGTKLQLVLDRKHCIEIERRQEMRRHYKNLHSFHNAENDIPADYKAEMTDFYKRRCTAKNIGNQTKNGSNPLKDGHCMNCLAKFVTLKNPDECKYHPGFIELDTNWSCCGLEAECFHPTLAEHIKTGCLTGVHNWRHGKDEKKIKKQMKSKTLNRIKVFIR